MAPETPKGVSSRLLTMKFMQRAAASASSAASPDSAGPSKKRKHEHSPAKGKFDAQIDQALIQAALDDQEATRQAALAKHSAADTHWTLETTCDKAASTHAASSPLNVVYVGYGDLDSDDESGGKEDMPAKGRTSSRIVKKPDDKQRRKKRESSDKSGSQSSGDGDEAPRKRKHSDDGSDGSSPQSVDRSRSRSQSRHDKESARAKEFRDKRRKKEIRLGQITSISSGGGGGSPSGGRGLTCHSCQQSGHKSSDCPKRSKRRS